MGTEYDPFGREYRTGRLSDEQTAERMLSTAVDKVSRDGLQVSFDLLRVEDLIVEAGVARSAVYRRWPTKHHFYADLLRRLAGQPHPTTAAHGGNTLTFAVQLVRDHADRLATEQGRRWLAVELCRVGAMQNFDIVSNSPAWPIHVTLMATFAGLPADKGTLRPDLEAALDQSEQEFVAAMASFYQRLLPMLGHRFRPDIPGLTVETVIALGAAVIEGLALNPFVSALVPQQVFVADPFDTGETAEWSIPSLGFASIWFRLVESDPGQSGAWSDQEVADTLERLAAIAAGEASPR